MYFVPVTLETAVGELAPRVLRYCVGYVGDRSLGEEIAQESLAALVKAVIDEQSEQIEHLQRYIAG